MGLPRKQGIPDFTGISFNDVTSFLKKEEEKKKEPTPEENKPMQNTMSIQNHKEPLKNLPHEVHTNWDTTLLEKKIDRLLITLEQYDKSYNSRFMLLEAGIKEVLLKQDRILNRNIPPTIQNIISAKPMNPAFVPKVKPVYEPEVKTVEPSPEPIPDTPTSSYTAREGPGEEPEASKPRRGRKPKPKASSEQHDPSAVLIEDSPLWAVEKTVEHILEIMMLQSPGDFVDLDNILEGIKSMEGSPIPEGVTETTREQIRDKLTGRQDVLFDPTSNTLSVTA